MLIWKGYEAFPSSSIFDRSDGCVCTLEGYVEKNGKNKLNAGRNKQQRDR